MADRILELEEDINELQQFMLQAERPNVQGQLAQLLSKLRTELEQLNVAKPIPEAPKTVPITPVPQPSKESDLTKYTSLTKYAWDQEGNKVKIFFSLDGVGSECSKDQIDVIFDKWSVDVRIRGYKKQNLIFAIKKLFGEINPTDSKFLLKTNMLTVTLTKKDNKSWSQLAFKEEKFSAKPEKEEEKPDDPNASIMNMMKKMYEEGDDNMKRTLAEAWTKANDKKAEKPDFSDRYDFLKK